MKKTFLFLFAASLLTLSTTVGGEKEKAVLKVKGMHCASCVSMVKKSVKKVDGVQDATINLESGEVTFLFEPAKKPVEDVIRAINKMGYKVIRDDSSSVPSENTSTVETKN